VNYYTIEGVGIKTGRKRVRTFVAADDAELLLRLEKDGTKLVKVVEKRPKKNEQEAPIKRAVDPDTNATIKAIQAAGAAACMVQIKYRKPGDTWVTDRTVEPYDFEKSWESLIVLTWQVSPVIDGDAWRHFRVDRIVSITPTGKPFKPRKPITVHSGAVGRFDIDKPDYNSKAPSKPSIEQQYATELREALADGDLNVAELDRLITLNQMIDRRRLAGLHAQHYAQALMDLSLDGVLDDVEENRLTNIRIFLDQLGWTP
jgi:hypothetical protein